MPRKRTIRGQVPKPAPGKLVVSEEMSNNERKEQLAVFLKDYDSKVKSILKEFDKRKRTLLTVLQTRFENHLADLPKEIREMTLEEFARRGGTIEAALAPVGELVENPKQKQLTEIMNLKWPAQSLEDIQEEGSDNIGATTSVKTVGRPRKQPQRKNAYMTGCESARSNTRSSKYLLTKTPLNSNAGLPSWGQTPMVTPKFDPYLKLTPENIRTVKPGEKILMSMAGSPVRPTQNESVCASSKKEITQEWSGIVGVDLTPNRIDQMLHIISKAINKNSNPVDDVEGNTLGR